MSDHKFYSFYTFQHRKTHQSPWGTKSPICKIKPEREWSFSSWDHFGWSFHRLDAKGEKWIFPGGEEPHDVWVKTGGSKGYWSLKYARGALKRLQAANDKGEWNIKYGCDIQQAARYEFRIVKVTKFDKVVEIIS
jgi:hypothetical protein